MWNALCVPTSWIFFLFSSSFFTTFTEHTTNITFIKLYVKFQTAYKKLCNKMSNICSSTVTVQILHVRLSSRKCKTVYLLLKNFKADIQNHIPVIITDSILFLDFYGDRRHSWIVSDTPKPKLYFHCMYMYIYIWTICVEFTLYINT